MEPEKSLPLRPSVVCIPLVVVATKPVTMSRPVKSGGTSLLQIRLARRPLHRRSQRAPFDDDDLARIDPQHLALDARALAQKRREQPRRPDLAVARDHVAHRVGRRADEAHGLQHAGDVAAIAFELRAVVLARGLARSASAASSKWRVFSASMADGEIAVGPLRQRRPARAARR